MILWLCLASTALTGIQNLIDSISSQRQGSMPGACLRHTNPK
jgi:hypothetical protein